MNKIFHWVKANNKMLVNAGSLVGTTIVTSVLGFVYWWVAARRFTPEVVGIGSAAISSMTLLGTFCVLGLGTLLITEIPRQPKLAVPLISTALVVVAIAGGLAGLLFALVAPIFSSQFSYLNASIVDAISYAVGTSLTSITLVLDQALIGLLCGVQQFHRNSLFAAIKLIALFLISILFSNMTGMSVYATWSLGNLLSVIVVLIPILFKSRKSFRNYLPQWNLLRKMGRPALQHHLLNTMLQFTAYALPTIVTVLLSARTNALFYVSWMLVNFIFYIPAALTIVLHAMNSAHQSTLSERARTTIGIALVISIIATIVLQFTTKQVLGMFGSAYIGGIWVLRILVFAAFPIIIKNHYISICRIQDCVKNAMYIIAPGCFLELGLSVGGAHISGLFGLSLGWVIAIYIEAIFMLPTIYKTVFAVKPSAISIEEDLTNVMAKAIWLIDTSMLPAIDTSGFPIAELVNKGKDYEEYKNSNTKLKLSSNNLRRLKPPRLLRVVSYSSSALVDENSVADSALEKKRKSVV